jgi:hypothetical protein
MSLEFLVVVKTWFGGEVVLYSWTCVGQNHLGD